jgi:hypothetical protein
MHLPLPGGHAELADPKILTPDHQDLYQDLLAEIQEQKEQAVIDAAMAAHPGMIPDPDAPAPKVRLTRKDLKPLHDLTLALVVQEISFAGILPWDAGSRGRLCAAGGLGAWNALLNSMAPYFTLLLGNTPKETPTSGTTSASTSSGTAAAPPADSPPESSAVPSS